MPEHQMESGRSVDDLIFAEKRFAELTTIELHDILELRSRVFIVEQTCAYADIDRRDREAGTVHAWATSPEGAIAAYARLLSDNDGAARIGRVVTDPEWRGEGLAAHLVRSLCEKQHAVFVLDAQSYLVSWYTNLGFVSSGDEFVEDGIPHTPMRRELGPAKP